MFEPVLDHKPRGFSGRPFAALAFAVGTGFCGSYLLSRIGLQASSSQIIIVAFAALIGFLWDRVDHS